MKKILLIMLSVGILIGIITVNALAAGPDSNRPMCHNFLNLTPDQQQKMLTLRQEFQKDTMDLRFALQQKRLELRQLWSANPPSQNAIDAKTKEVNALRIQMIAKTQTFKDKVKTILTPEQLKHLNDRMTKSGPGMRRQGRGNGGFMGFCY